MLFQTVLKGLEKMSTQGVGKGLFRLKKALVKSGYFWCFFEKMSNFVD
jgi:hypothetical protein